MTPSPPDADPAPLDRTLVDWETAGWQSLVDGTARAYWRDRLAPDAVVVLPGGGLARSVVAGADALDRISGSTWAWFQLRAPQVTRLGQGAVAITYRIVARRDFDVEYRAVVTSTWVRDESDPDTWRLAVHQQTPV